MSRRRRIRSRLCRAVRRFARIVGWLAALMVSAWLVAAVAGPLGAAGAGAGVFTAAAIRWWARVEARVFDSPQPPTELVRPAVSGADHRHLAFAQALAVVAARFLAECEAENRS